MNNVARKPVQRIKVMLVIDGLGLGGAEMVVRDLVKNLDTKTFRSRVCVQSYFFH